MTTHEAGSDIRRTDRIIHESGLAEQIEGQIERRASGRIRDLHVVCSEEQIILTGRSRTYHAKQLAQQVVLDFTDGHHALANEIVVGC
ncbi:hypothetical protein P12x_003136 [Tundrisphaera lichenicola]|uniref:hypothetical protein n=1 Tax=Tundrisphaera lichenicola TaxID=2029860 RepID=UPI003EB7F761